MSMPQLFLDGRVRLHAGDCLDVLAALPDESVDSIVTDPPYHLTSIAKRFGGANAVPARDYTGERDGATGAYARASRGFMGQQWDGGDIAFRAELWAQVMRVLRPGGHVVAFSATRTYHRMACALEDAGFEIRDQLAWVYGTGFPKSLNIGRALQAQTIAGGCGPEAQRRAADGVAFSDGDALQWQGWGTALKPAWEPICLARKPIAARNVAENVLEHGTGGLNIGATRVGDGSPRATATAGIGRKANPIYGDFAINPAETFVTTVGRWPANIVHDGSPEVVAAFPAGSAARFFYSAKAGAYDRLKSKHPTVKPVDLMRWLVRLVTPPGGVVLDPFAGTGTTGAAAWLEGFSAVLVEREAEYRADIARRMTITGVVESGAASRKDALAMVDGVFG